MSSNDLELAHGVDAGCAYTGNVHSFLKKILRIDYKEINKGVPTP